MKPKSRIPVLVVSISIALNSFQTLPMDRAGNRKLVMILRFMTGRFPIVDDPRIEPLCRAKCALRLSSVAKHFPTASISGRSRDKSWPVIAQFVHDILKDYPRLRLTHGRKVLEVRPAIDWDKGKAVEFLLESLGFSSSDDVLPIYIGDDRTDEDAFKLLRDRNRGHGILVSAIPKEKQRFSSR
ncbi:putative trehalose-phosphate phosphatase F [Sesamum alatum]|uniref:Trehalose-phosphate phosphatase F n=1 Tax=Sesamum alatum TaxID=300844 RepID=A0AAE2CKQ8_9LAMI|nr:putative trehalose-phosphate phosphatase F [Sesamum alatum]